MATSNRDSKRFSTPRESKRKTPNEYRILDKSDYVSYESNTADRSFRTVGFL